MSRAMPDGGNLPYATIVPKHLGSVIFSSSRRLRSALLLQVNDIFNFNLPRMQRRRTTSSDPLVQVGS